MGLSVALEVHSTVVSSERRSAVYSRPRAGSPYSAQTVLQYAAAVNDCRQKRVECLPTVYTSHIQLGEIKFTVLLKHVTRRRPMSH